MHLQFLGKSLSGNKLIDMIAPLTTPHVPHVLDTNTKASS